MMDMRRVTFGLSLMAFIAGCAMYIASYNPVDGVEGESIVVIKPKEYRRALRNPLKGFTNRGFREDNEWATLVHCYIPWNQIENRGSDGIDKIRKWCDEKWEHLPKRNQKVIPRVYLHWSGDRKYWPADMEEDDYTSQQFINRVIRLVGRLGECWDDDPRVAFVELGIFGKWGEQHSPDPTREIQQIVGTEFVRAFKNKLVSVRRPWEKFDGFGFGGYWDSWAHYQQMWGHGSEIARLNQDGLWKKNYIGGEAAYDWGDWAIQPGKTPTDSVSKAIHRNFVINTIQWLHCTQLRWIADYDRKNAKAVKGGEEMQKVLGYRFVLNEVSFTKNDQLKVLFKVTNEGSAPFYYDWPVEISLLDVKTREPVWKSTFENADIREWLPGDGWPEPTWKHYDKWPSKVGEWDEGEHTWKNPPKIYMVSGDFEVNAPTGTYILALAVLDPAGNMPSLRFATANCINGGRHPIGLFAVGEGEGGSLPDGFEFDDPHADDGLHYIAK